MKILSNKQYNALLAKIRYLEIGIDYDTINREELSNAIRGRSCSLASFRFVFKGKMYKLIEEKQ
tara:strand:- start:38005 stop:38196 length:192 start_codon:yes stop_codon:yes gene_type:complete